MPIAIANCTAIDALSIPRPRNIVWAVVFLPHGFDDFKAFEGAMKVKHSAVKSPIYEILKVLELDLQLGDESWPIRFELFRNTEIKGRFRCRIWQAEYFRIQSTFPSSARGKPKHPSSDELILIKFDGPKMGDYDDFAAPNADAAMAVVLRDFERFLEHTTLEKPR